MLRRLLSLRARHFVPCGHGPGMEWHGEGRASALSTQQELELAGQSQAESKAGSVTLLTPNWLSLSSFILSLIQLTVGNSRRINGCPSLRHFLWCEVFPDKSG